MIQEITEEMLIDDFEDSHTFKSEILKMTDDVYYNMVTHVLRLCRC